jgi:hypothetical protein
MLSPILPVPLWERVLIVVDHIVDHHEVQDVYKLRISQNHLNASYVVDCGVCGKFWDLCSELELSLWSDNLLTTGAILQDVFSKPDFLANVAQYRKNEKNKEEETKRRTSSIGSLEVL